VRGNLEKGNHDRGDLGSFEKTKMLLRNVEETGSGRRDPLRWVMWGST